MSLRQSVRDVVANALHEAGIASILVTHDQAEALSYADQVAIIRHGEFAQVGPPEELYLRPLTMETAIFMGKAILLQAQAGEGYVDCLLGRIPAATQGKGRNGPHHAPPGAGPASCQPDLSGRP